MKAVRAVGIFIAGGLAGLAVGYRLFSGEPVSSAPLCREGSAELQPPLATAVVPPARPVPREERRATVISNRGAENPPSPGESQAVGRLREEIEFERTRHAEESGRQALEAPPALPNRFVDQQAIRDFWRGRIREAGFPDAEPVVSCDEYPCYALLDGVGVQELPILEQSPLTAPFEADRVAAVTFSRPSDGGSRWLAAVALIPSEEPSIREKSVTNRLVTRALVLSRDAGFGH